MRRLALLFAGGAVWLFLLAIPVFADGGPHQAIQNSAYNPLTGGLTYSGTTGLASGVLTSDNCAGCHRAHTAQGFDITTADTPALCLTCHGSAVAGATTDVIDGVQYTALAAGSFNRAGSINNSTTPPSWNGTVLGALRAGGFVNARIDSSDPGRISYPRDANHGATGTVGNWVASFTANVPVLAAGAPVTSRHMDPTGPVLATVWGSGPLGTAGAGATMQLNCTSCHNPHGNGNYRILNPIPTSDQGLGTFTAATTGVNVKDGPLPTGTALGANIRNYTVIQNNTTGAGGGSNSLLTVADVANAALSSTAGDYWHKNVPWYGTATYSGGTWSFANMSATSGKPDNPTGLSYTGNLFASPTTIKDSFSNEVSAWCAQCHQRYHTGLQPGPGGLTQQTPSGDTIFNYRHGTVNNGCLTCHVGHGSNAIMNGTYSSSEAFPGSTTGSADSRLLKVDNRGTCQLCHDPTGTVPAGVPAGTLVGATIGATSTYSGPAVPYYPAP